MDLILYHGHCPDGWTAAFIASKRYPEAQLVAQDHGLEPPYSLVENKETLVVDFSWRTREQNDEMARLAKSFRILDHHKTAQAVLEGAPYATFDMKRSGAGLAWDYLFGKDKGIAKPNGPGEDFMVVNTEFKYWEDRPWFVNFVEDRDLWNWNLPYSKEVCAYLGTLEFTHEAWNQLEYMDIQEAIEKGEGALAHIEHYTREAIKQAQFGEFEGLKTAVLNVPYLNCSEVGNALAKQVPVSLTWFERGDGIIQFSLRSEGDIDVSVIAKKFNGGGHLHAAGFQLKLGEGRRLVDQILNRPSMDTL